MTALAGLWSFEGQLDLRSSVVAMLAAQSACGPHHPNVEILGNAALGRGLYPLLPQDHLDAQPIVNRGEQWMLAADVRIDNRDELLDALGSPRSMEISDSELLFRAYDRSRDGIVDCILGDYAFVVWEAQSATLTLVRDPTGQRPLHYSVGKGWVAISSMAQGLHALPMIERRTNERLLAEFVADIPRSGPETFFENITRVEPGHVVKISRDGVRTRQYWAMPSREIRYTNDDDYLEAFREQLDRATLARLRGVTKNVGAHLSAGLDSGAVAATAARLMAPSGGRVIALTSAPRAGFDGALPRGRIGDESALAAAVAALNENMDHIVVRPGRISPLDLLRRDSRVFGEPIGLPCNQVWWSAVNDEARARGVNVMLTGEFGNLAMSAGAAEMMAEFIRTGRWMRWLKEIRSFRGGEGPRLRGLLASSFSPWMPRSLWRAVIGFVRGPNVASEGVLLLNPRWRPIMERRGRIEARNGHPERIERLTRWKILAGADPGNFRKGTLAAWGIDERDATADRRLVEFCFSLPPEQFLSGGMTRRLARRGLADRLPPSVLYGPRGYQFADWHESISGAKAGEEIRELSHHQAATSLLDFGRLQDLVRAWPSGGWDSLAVIAKYRIALLRALSAARFASAGDR